MSGINDQTKQQVLTRIAGTRVRAVDAVESVRKGAQGCVRALPFSPAALKTLGMALGGVAVSGLLVSKMKKRRRVAAKAAESPISGRVVTLQALSALAIPLLQRWLTSQQNTASARTTAPAEGRSFRFAFPDLNAAFFRWLGLQK